MPTLEATRIVRYAGRDQQPGDRFEASDKDAKILIAIQKAKLSDGPAKSPSDLPDEVMSRASKPEPEPVAEEDEVEEPETEVAEVEKDVDPKPAQTYLHRALVAEAPKAKPVEPMRFTPSPAATPMQPASRPPGRTGKGRKSRS